MRIMETLRSLLEASRPRIVEVKGVGKVSLPPDSLDMSVSVQVRGEKLEAARDEAAAKTRAIMKALEDLRIASLEVRTASISVFPVSERGTERAAPPAIVGYEASSSVSVALEGVSRDVLRAETSRILEAALSSGANQVSGVRFFLSKPQDAYRAALQASIEDAQKNAGSIADAARIKLVGWQSVSTTSEGRGARAVKRAPAARGARSITFPIEPEDIEVSASVKALFRFAKP